MTERPPAEFVNAKHSTRKALVGEMHRKTEPIGVTPPSTDQREIVGRKRIVPDDCRRIVGGIEQRRTCLRREDFMLIHRRLPCCAIGRSRSSPAFHYFSMPWYLRNSIAKIPANLHQRLSVGFWEDSAMTPI